jgi:hypothetical protein
MTEYSFLVWGIFYYGDCEGAFKKTQGDVVFVSTEAEVGGWGCNRNRALSYSVLLRRQETWLSEANSTTSIKLSVMADVEWQWGMSSD